MAETFKVPDMSDEELKQFVRDFVAGKIFTSMHISPSEPEMVRHIFMPLVFGGFRYPVPPPEIPTPPKLDIARPESPVFEATPDPETEALREDLQAARERLHRMEQDAHSTLDDLECDRALSDIDSLKVDIVKSEERHKEKDQERYRERRRAHVAVVQAYRQARKNLWPALKAWTETNRHLSEQFAAWQKDEEAYIASIREELALIWEYMTEACPLSINGYPSFFSMRLMSRRDFQRVWPAIQRELKRDIEL